MSKDVLWALESRYDPTVLPSTIKGKPVFSASQSPNRKPTVSRPFRSNTYKTKMCDHGRLSNTGNKVTSVDETCVTPDVDGMSCQDCCCDQAEARCACEASSENGDVQTDQAATGSLKKIPDGKRGTAGNVHFEIDVFETSCKQETKCACCKWCNLRNQEGAVGKAVAGDVDTCINCETSNMTNRKVRCAECESRKVECTDEEEEVTQICSTLDPTTKSDSKVFCLSRKRSLAYSEIIDLSLTPLSLKAESRNEDRGCVEITEEHLVVYSQEFAGVSKCETDKFLVSPEESSEMLSFSLPRSEPYDNFSSDDSELLESNPGPLKCSLSVESEKVIRVGYDYQFRRSLSPVLNSTRRDNNAGSAGTREPLDVLFSAGEHRKSKRELKRHADEKKRSKRHSGFRDETTFAISTSPILSHRVMLSSTQLSTKGMGAVASHVVNRRGRIARREGSEKKEEGLLKKALNYITFGAYQEDRKLSRVSNSSSLSSIEFLSGHIGRGRFIWDSQDDLSDSSKVSSDMRSSRLKGDLPRSLEKHVELCPGSFAGRFVQLTIREPKRFSGYHLLRAPNLSNVANAVKNILEKR